MFTNKKMNEKEKMKDIDGVDGITDEAIPFNDKRRFNADGERVVDEPIPAEPVRSASELALEGALKAEIERREAAEAKLVGVQAKFDEAKANLDRETAEMRSRMLRTLGDRSKQEQFDFLTLLLPVLDNLNLAIASSETDSSVEHLRDGVIGTARSFEQALMSVGVEPIPAVNAKFDPELHEAIDTTEVDAASDETVTEEYSRGYKFGDRLLRASKVQVGKAKQVTAGGH